MTKINKKKQTYVLSVGGSLIVPNEVDAEFLKKFRALVLKKIKEGDKFVIMCGGGKINSKYNEAARKITAISDADLDWIGIYASRLNAQLMRALFGDLAHREIIIDPTKKIKTAKPIIIGAGYKPGWSTDYDAVMIAKVSGAKTVINLSNIDCAYTDDPKTNPEAKPIKNISWKDFRKIVGNVWKPRMNKPFDPIASKLAQICKIKVIIMNGRNIKNFENCLEGKEFQGTEIE
ncbi:UMP kinase [Patescibacteria group bacterium]|nr:UMP kinase [Patescibacteria group bacterium]